MALVNLSSATSVQDYLKTKGQDNSFSARKELYNKYGFNKTMGDFIGSGNQNINLLKRLQQEDNPKLSTTVPGGFPLTPPKPTLSSAVGTRFQTTTPATLAGAIKTPTPAPQTPASSLLRTLGLPETKISAANPGAPAPAPTPTPTPQPKIQTPTPTPTPTPTNKDADVVKVTGGISANSLFPDTKDEGEADVVNTWLTSAEGQAFLNRQENKLLDEEAKSEATKAAFEAKYAGDVQNLEEALAANGLAFSGIRGAKVKALADSLASSLLGADRELASKLLDADADLRDAIIKGVSELAKDAKEGRKEAIQQLNAIGYAVIGDQLVPTLSARSAERADAAAIMSERRLQLAEESAARAEAQFNATYGEGAGEFFKSVQALITAAPDATEQDIRLAIRANPQVFGKVTEAQLDDAVSLVGMPPNVKDDVVIDLLSKNFDKPGFTRIFAGDQVTAAFDLAKEEAKKKLLDSGGEIPYTSPDGKTRTYKLTTAQLSELTELIDTMTVDDLD